MKDETYTSIDLVPSENYKIPLVLTKYPQGRGNEPKLGPPFSVCLGFPATIPTLNTKEKRKKKKEKKLKNLLNSVSDKSIEIKDFFGTSEYFVVMINGGCKAPHLAYTEAHKKLLMQENPTSQVLIIFLKNLVCVRMLTY